jgi:regulation of enolase protein 1 (concanavalin A-like superfamily)
MEVKTSSPNFLLLCLIICSLSLPALADGPAVQWEKTFGGSGFDQGRSVQQTTDGGFIIAGETSSFGAGGGDVYLIKTDPNGNFLWQKTFGGSSGEWGCSVQQTSDGGYIISGDTYSFGAGYHDVYLIKTDPDGNLLWQNTFGGSGEEIGYSAQQTSDGGYIIAGETGSFGAVKSDVYLIKTDPNGNLLWQKTFGGSEWNVGYSVKETSDGGFIITGYTSSFGAGYPDVYLVKTDPNGNLLWQKTFGGSEDGWGLSVQQTSDGGFVIAGEIYSYITDDSDVYLIKTDPNGNLIWQKTFGGSSFDQGLSVQQTTDGGFIITGQTSSFDAGENDVYLIKTDPNGNLLWQKTFGGIYDDSGCSVQQTSDGGFVIAGHINYAWWFISGDVYLVKLCSESTSLGDLNCDGRVDFDDFAILANQWFQQPSIPSADIAPAVRDNLVDFRDLAAFVEYWLEGTTP